MKFVNTFCTIWSGLGASDDESASEDSVKSGISSWLGSVEVGKGCEADGLVGSDVEPVDLFGKDCGEVIIGRGPDFCFGVGGPGDNPGDPGVSMVANRSENSNQLSCRDSLY